MWQEAGQIEIKAEAEDKDVRVSVFNTGTPIPEEEQEHIWEKFYKVDKAHSRTYGGSGIGLSIVKAVMEAHDMPQRRREVSCILGRSLSTDIPVTSALNICTLPDCSLGNRANEKTTMPRPPIHWVRLRHRRMPCG